MNRALAGPVGRHASLVLLLVAACAADGSPSPTGSATRGDAGTTSAAPSTRTVDVVDDYHGTTVADPYRWLEDQDGADVRAWATAQNGAARAVLDRLPGRDGIAAQLREVWNVPRFDSPTRAGERWFWQQNDGLQNQSVLMVADAPDARGEVLLDPNTLSSDGTVALGGVAFSKDGARLAYATSQHGSDWRQWHVLDVATHTTLTDRLDWSKFSTAAWTEDGAGFFYQRYPAPKEGETYQAENRQPQLCYHAVGTEQSADRVVYERPDQPDWAFSPLVSDDGRFLVVEVSSGTDQRNRVVYADLREDGWPVQALLMDFDAAYDFVDNDGDTFFFTTTANAPNGRVIAVDRREPAREGWRTVVAERKDALRGARFVGDRFVCNFLVDASSRLLLFAQDGSAQGAIDLPAIGNAYGMTGRRGDAALHYSFTSFTHPPAVWRYDLAAKTSAPLRATPGAADDLVTTQVFPQSKDGARLSMFIVHRKDLRLDGSSRCYLWGYGGFDIPVTPGHSPQNLVFVRRGGIYAQAVLRGGGEYGETWHRAGMLGNKQNVFDDFVACADYLVRNGYTQRARLGIGGGSNGGLLVGAVLTQHPELVGAAIPEVGVLDMLRYHRFTIGWAWASEYGRSDDKEQFAWLYRYSPLHNVHRGTAYPPTLIMTGDHDDRVLPGHSYKFAATLQAAQGGPAPILLRVETNAGHGAGKPVQKRLDEAVDRIAFLEWALGG